MTQPQTAAAETVDTCAGLLEQPTRVVVYLVTPRVIEAEVSKFVVAICHCEPLWA